jgi:hypothetical protein
MLCSNGGDRTSNGSMKRAFVIRIDRIQLRKYLNCNLYVINIEVVVGIIIYLLELFEALPD